MSYTSFPVSNQLHSRTIISGANLAMAPHPDRAIRHQIESVQEGSIRNILERCTRQTPIDGTTDILIELDCFVFTFDELKALLANARMEGQREAERWMRPHR